MNSESIMQIRSALLLYIFLKLYYLKKFFEFDTSMPNNLIQRINIVLYSSIFRFNFVSEYKNNTLVVGKLLMANKVMKQLDAVLPQDFRQLTLGSG